LLRLSFLGEAMCDLVVLDDWMMPVGLVKSDTGIWGEPNIV
jgi:hypothetical protein